MKSVIKKHRKLFVAGLLFLLLICFVYIFRFPILKSASDYLIAEDPLVKADAIFVLSGRPFERGLAAMEIYFQGHANHVVCMGSNVPQDLLSLGFNYKESELIQHFLTNRMEIPKENVSLLPLGSSTYEESEAILDYSLTHKFDTVIIVSSAFHTRRIQLTFREKFQEAGIHTIVRGHIRESDPPYWWQDENSIINLNNEYIKIVYYWLRY